MRYTKADQQAQALEIIELCYEKKFSKNAKKMAEWLETTSPSVARWRSGGEVPGWVVLKILTEYPDVKDFVFAGGTVTDEDTDVRVLRERIDRLLESKFMFDHLNVQVGICEAAERQKQVEIDRAEALRLIDQVDKSPKDIKRLNELVQRVYGEAPERMLAVHESAETHRKTLPGKTSQAAEGTPGADPSSETPAGGKPGK